MSYAAFADFVVPSSKAGAGDYTVQPLDAAGSPLGPVLSGGLTATFGWFGSVPDGTAAVRLVSASLGTVHTAAVSGRDSPGTTTLLGSVSAPVATAASLAAARAVIDGIATTLAGLVTAVAGVPAAVWASTIGQLVKAFADRNPDPLAKPSDVQGGGGSGGDGDVLVDHNFGGTDNLRVLSAAGVPADNVLIRGYVTADLVVGIIDPTPPETLTGSDGRWTAPLMLDAGAYTLNHYDPATKRVFARTITVA